MASAMSNGKCYMVNGGMSGVSVEGNANKTQHIGKISRSFARQLSQLDNWSTVAGQGLIYRAIRWVFVRLFAHFPCPCTRTLTLGFISFQIQFMAGECHGRGVDLAR